MLDDKVRKNRRSFPVAAALVLVMLLAWLPAAAAERVLTIFHAGSLSIPLAAMEKEFEKSHPGVDVQREPGGSTKCARKIVDLKKPCDIMASADYKVIDKLLLPAYGLGNIRFATNRMVLCYTPKSREAAVLTAENWMEILARPDISWGHSDPNLDPCGYRALMVLQLAENYYKQPGLYDRLYQNGRVMRPKSVELIALLETGSLDYAWEYRSVAVQHGLEFLELPAEINLGDYRFDERYATAEVEVSGKTPGSTMTVKGKSITYGVTLIKEAPQMELAVEFLAYMLAPEGGLRILADNGQPPFIPARVPDAAMRAQLPAELQSLVTVQP